MAKPFTDVPASKRDAESPATEELFTFQNDNAESARGVDKISKTFTDFQAAATTKTITLVNLPASAEMIRAYANVTTAFTGAGSESVQIGDDDAPDINSFMKGLGVTTIVFRGFKSDEKGVRLDETTSPPVVSFSTTFNVTATMTAATNLDNLTAGVVDFYIVSRALDSVSA